MKNNIIKNLSEIEVNEIRLRSRALQKEEVAIILQELPSDCLENEIKNRKIKYIQTLDKVRTLLKIGDNESLDALKNVLDEINKITKMD